MTLLRYRDLKARGIVNKGRRIRLVPYSFEFGGFPSPNS
jgi:hypothetical protein